MSLLPGPPAITAPTEQMQELVADEKDIRRMSADPEAHRGISERQWGFQARLRPGVTYEEFTHWAKIERQLEEEELLRYRSITAGEGFVGGLKGYFTSNAYEDAKARSDAANATASALADASAGDDGSQSHGHGEKAVVVASGHAPGIASAPSSDDDLDAEWRQASRALRTAGWGAIFYLITTDILGWGQTPYVFSNTGYGLGAGIFVLMGIAAGASGFMIWRTFLALDSSRYPMVTFGDAFFRLFGPKTRHFINILQSFQMFMSVAVVQLGQTLILAQLAGSANLCLVVCGIISLVVGMASGYMRSLKHIGWFCNASVWINIVSFIIM